MIYIIGRTSYIGGLINEHLIGRVRVAVIGLAELANVALSSDDVLVNSTFDRRFYDQPISADLGPDGVVANLAERAGSRYVMISSRAVYAPRLDPPLQELEACRPSSIYGQNKLRIEQALQGLLGSRLLILRLANVFGGEPSGRRTFVSMALESLKTTGAVYLEMDPATKKDFVPSHVLGKAAAALIHADERGIVNIGSGVALRVDELVMRLIKVHGAGECRVTSRVRGEEFLLDNTKMRNLTGIEITRSQLLVDVENAANFSLQGVGT
jgi:nucleoside-diphosphate-sugar epimerase